MMMKMKFRSRLLRTFSVFLFSAAVLVMITGCGKGANMVIGIVADVQYADKPAQGARTYRQSLMRLERAAEFFNSDEIADMSSNIFLRRRPEFVIQLGDFIDGGDTAMEDLQRVCDVYSRIKCRRYHVLGNHDFAGLERSTVMKILGLERGYYDFTVKGWRFIVLDTMDLSVSGGWDKNSEHYRLGQKMLDELAATGAKNAQDWNGGLSDEQLDWLRTALADAKDKQQKVIVFGHLPLLPKGEKHALYNSEEVIKLFEKSGCTAAYFCGHSHKFSWLYHNGIYYVTIDGMVETKANLIYALLWIYDDRLELVRPIEPRRLRMPLENTQETDNHRKDLLKKQQSEQSN